MQLVPLTEICKSSNNGDDDEDDMYFPTVQELIAGQGVSRGYVPRAVDKSALDDDNRSINPDKFILGPTLGNSQGIRSTVSKVMEHAKTGRTSGLRH
jgi:hypothetical protein